MIPLAILEQHTAILGKTGSGKTSTGKLAVEQVVAAGERVCILDPVKSDWWGLTSSADGQRPGLPFHILGGPRGHVPLHSSAGAAIGELVATGALPLSIIDMADFEPGGLQRFFVDFAPALLKRMRGVVHLVMEEAHEFCLSDDTEILTRRGFKQHTEISKGDDAVCFDLATGRYSYGAIERVIRYRWEGDATRLQSDGLDSLSTPDHRVVLRRVQRGVGRYKLYDWTFCPASEVPTCVAVPIGGAPLGAGVPDLTNDEARILGWIITDGNLHPAQTREPRIALTQSSTTTKLGALIAEEMTALLSAIPGVSRYQREERVRATMGRVLRSAPSFTWYFGGESSRGFLAWLGDELHRVPRKLIDQGSRPQLEALYRGLLEGDGTSNSGRWVRFYPGFNSGLADDFQEIALRLGISATKQRQASGQWAVFIANERRMHWVRKPQRERYAGTVWDVTVPTGAFVARRNGKVFVTGNCPKERAGIGAENLSIHWAKKLATAGRSKGIRLILATQRTQALHNAMLGSCETVIVHRLTAPADQEPVKKWLQANTTKDVRVQVESTLASLKTGCAWICSGEAGIFEQVQFPRIKTYDNSATPTSGGGEHQVKTAPVDQDKLRAIIGHAVKEAEENDPKRLKGVIARLTQEVTAARAASSTATPAAAPDTEAIEAARQDGYQDGYRTGHEHGHGKGATDTRTAILSAWDRHAGNIGAALQEVQARVSEAQRDMGASLSQPYVAPAPAIPVKFRQNLPNSAAPRTATPPRGIERSATNGSGKRAGPEQRILDALAELRALGVDHAPRVLVAFLAGYGHVNSKGFTNGIGALRTAGAISYPGESSIALTPEGARSAGHIRAPLTSEELHARIIALLGGAEERVLRPLIEAYPRAVAREALHRAAGYDHPNSKGFTNAMGKLRTLGFIDYPDRGAVQATPLLFLEARR